MFLGRAGERKVLTGTYMAKRLLEDTSANKGSDGQPFPENSTIRSRRNLGFRVAALIGAGMMIGLVSILIPKIPRSDITSKTSSALSVTLLSNMANNSVAGGLLTTETNATYHHSNQNKKDYMTFFYVNTQDIPLAAKKYPPDRIERLASRAGEHDISFMAEVLLHPKKLYEESGMGWASWPNFGRNPVVDFLSDIPGSPGLLVMTKDAPPAIHAC